MESIYRGGRKNVIMKYGQGSHQFVNMHIYVRSASRLVEYQCLLQASCNNASAVRSADRLGDYQCLLQASCNNASAGRSAYRLGDYQCLLQASCNNASAVCVRHQTNKNSSTFPENCVQMKTICSYICPMPASAMSI